MCRVSKFCHVCTQILHDGLAFLSPLLLKLLVDWIATPTPITSPPPPAPSPPSPDDYDNADSIFLPIGDGEGLDLLAWMKQACILAWEMLQVCGLHALEYWWTGRAIKSKMHKIKDISCPVKYMVERDAQHFVWQNSVV